MPASYRIDRARRLVLSSATGVLTHDDLRAHMRNLAGDSNFDPSFRQIFDFRAVTNLEVTGAALRELAQSNPWKKRTRRAFVCDRDVLFGMARMFQLLTNGAPAEIQVFREMSEALAWLGLDAIE